MMIYDLFSTLNNKENNKVLKISEMIIIRFFNTVKGAKKRCISDLEFLWTIWVPASIVLIANSEPTTVHNDV